MMEHNILFRRQMAPERVDERLLLLAADDGDDEPPPRRKIQDPRAEFLKATKSRPVLQHPRDTSDGRIHENNETDPFGWPATAQNRVDLPLDVLPDIAFHVYPLDLIHLSRTNKTLRGALISKDSRKIWMTALGRTVDLPPCPSDMSEPLYAALVFDHHCFGCGINNAFWVDYALRIRMCERCYGENVVEGTEMLQSLPKKYRETVGQAALMLIPAAWHLQIGWLHGTNPLSNLMQDFYRKSELEAVLRLFWPLPEPLDIIELKPFVRERVNYVIQRHAHAFLVHMWDHVGRSCPDSKQRLIAYSMTRVYFREDAILTLRGPDWGEASSVQDPVVFEYLNSEVPEPQLDAPSPPEVKPFSQFVAERNVLERRGNVTRARRIAGRYEQLADWYPRVLSTHFSGSQWDRAVLPNAFDGVRLWKELAEQNYVLALIDKDTVMGEQQLQDVARGLRAYQKSVMECLASAVKAIGGISNLDPQGNGQDVVPGEDARDILLRPTALFRCEGCGDYPYPWPQINVHWQEKHPDESVWKHSQSQVYRAVVWEEGAAVGEKILAVLREHGLSEEEKNTEQLDMLIQNGRVFCACGDPKMAVPDEGPNWAALVKHISVHTTDNACRMMRFARDQSGAEERGVDPVWVDDHHDLSSCIKYLQDGADTSQAWKRVCADANARARINALFEQCPQNSRPVCCICAALTPDDQKHSTFSLPEGADAVVYHMQTKHGKDFEEKDVVFWENTIFETT